MGSALYRIRIDKIDQTVVKCTIFVIHPDVDYIPNTKTFAMSIIVECWRNMLENYFFPRESNLPISKNEARELAKNTKSYGTLKFMEKLSMGYIKYITKEEYEQIDLENYTYKGLKVAGYGTEGVGENKKYHIIMEENDEEFKKEVNKYIKSTKIINEKNFPWREWPKDLPEEEKDKFYDEYYALENVPQAEFIFKVINPELISFLIPQTEWETAIWQ